MEGDRQKTSNPSWTEALPYPSLLRQYPSAGARSLCVEGIFFFIIRLAGMLLFIYTVIFTME